MSGRRGAGGREVKNSEDHTNMLLNFYRIFLVSFKAMFLWNERYSFLQPASLWKQRQASDRASYSAAGLNSIKQNLLLVLSRSEAETVLSDSSPPRGGSLLGWFFYKRGHARIGFLVSFFCNANWETAVSIACSSLGFLWLLCFRCFSQNLTTLEYFVWLMES